MPICPHVSLARDASPASHTLSRADRRRLDSRSWRGRYIGSARHYQMSCHEAASLRLSAPRGGCHGACFINRTRSVWSARSDTDPPIHCKDSAGWVGCPSAYAQVHSIHDMSVVNAPHTHDAQLWQGIIDDTRGDAAVSKEEGLFEGDPICFAGDPSIQHIGCTALRL